MLASCLQGATPVGDPWAWDDGEREGSQAGRGGRRGLVRATLGGGEWGGVARVWRGREGVWPVAGAGGGSDCRAAPPPFLPHPPLTAWLRHTAVTRIHLCHHPTAGLMSSPAKPLEHSTRAGPTPRSRGPGPASEGPSRACKSAPGLREAQPGACGPRCWPKPRPEDVAWTALARAGRGPSLVPLDPAWPVAIPRASAPTPGPGDSAG